MALQGMDPEAYDVAAVTTLDLHRLAGNAMCIPVVGTLLAACLSLIRPPCELGVPGVHAGL